MAPEGVPKSERLASLYLFFLGKGSPAALFDIERSIEGYAGLSREDDAAIRSFNRDLQDLEKFGMRVLRDDENRYLLDRHTSVMSELELDQKEKAVLAQACRAVLEDEGFPLREELLSAWMKLARAKAGCDADNASIGETGRKDATLAQLEESVLARKAVLFSYTKADGSTSKRLVEPCSLFSVDGDFYLLGRDLDAVGGDDDGIRQFKVGRISALKQKNTSSDPDFPPRNIHPRDFVDFPFAFGTERPFPAVFLMPKGSRNFVSGLLERRAAIFPLSGQSSWELLLAAARDAHKAAQWAYQHSPETLPVAPKAVTDLFLNGLEEVSRFGTAE